MASRFFIGLTLVLTIIAIYEISVLEIDHKQFGITRSLKIDANPHQFFRFLLLDDTLEKLLPWLTRLKEDDARILSVGKFYRAYCKLPIFGTNKIYLTIVEYRPRSFLVLESNDRITQQRVEILVENVENRTNLQSTVYLRKISAIYHYTVGLLLRYSIDKHLEKSIFRVAETYRSVEKCMRLLNDC